MKIEELLTDTFKEKERITFEAPKGTKDEIGRKTGRNGLSKFCRESIYKELKSK